MFDTIPFRLEKIEEELQRLEHPLNDDIHWLIGITTALLAVAELSSLPPMEHTKIDDLDS